MIQRYKSFSRQFAYHIPFACYSTSTSHRPPLATPACTPCAIIIGKSGYWQLYTLAFAYSVLGFWLRRMTMIPVKRTDVEYSQHHLFGKGCAVDGRMFTEYIFPGLQCLRSSMVNIVFTENREHSPGNGCGKESYKAQFIVCRGGLYTVSLCWRVDIELKNKVTFNLIKCGLFVACLQMKNVCKKSLLIIKTIKIQT